MWYRLHRRKTVLTDVFGFAEIIKNMHTRRIRRHVIKGQVISTVFLCLDHCYDGGPPLLFESMIFKDDETEMIRTATHREALRAHRYLVNKVKNNE